MYPENRAGHTTTVRHNKSYTCSLQSIESRWQSVLVLTYPLTFLVTWYLSMMPDPRSRFPYHHIPRTEGVSLIKACIRRPGDLSSESATHYRRDVIVLRSRAFLVAR
jgi:hypothetical protein